MTDIELIKKAIEARNRAYAPYSHHMVGAALECMDGTVYLGCNIESATYSPTICAERTAIFKAVSEGRRDFRRIAIVGGMEHALSLGICSPCGVCRQVMRAFVNPREFEIVLARVDADVIVPEKYTLEELLPMSFGPENLSV